MQRTKVDLFGERLGEQTISTQYAYEPHQILTYDSFYTQITHPANRKYRYQNCTTLKHAQTIGMTEMHH